MSRQPENDYRASLTPRQRELLDALLAKAFADVVIPWYERHPDAIEELRRMREARDAEKGEAA